RRDRVPGCRSFAARVDYQKNRDHQEKRSAAVPHEPRSVQLQCRNGPFRASGTSANRRALRVIRRELSWHATFFLLRILLRGCGSMSELRVGIPLWLGFERNPRRRRYRSLEHNIVADVVIVGGGLTGAV